MTLLWGMVTVCNFSISEFCFSYCNKLTRIVYNIRGSVQMIDWVKPRVTIMATIQILDTER